MEEELAPAHGAAHRGPVENVRLNGIGLQGGEPLEAPFVAEGDPDLVVPLGQLADDVAADEPGPAGDANLHVVIRICRSSRNNFSRRLGVGAFVHWDADRRPMNRTPLLLAVVAALALVAAAPAAASPRYVPGEVIVRYKDGTAATVRDRVEGRAGTTGGAEFPGGSEQVRIGDGDSVGETVRELRKDPNVAYAVPNYIARASTLLPNDPGFYFQWNLAGPTSINMPDAWEYARGRGAPGGRGAVVAVLDTGVAYERFGRFRRAPDLNRFARGYDFVGSDRHPNDLNGHGTHVAGTIAQSTNNGIGAAGIAYRAKIMPIRVLDAVGEGDTVAISRGIRFAAKRKVDGDQPQPRVRRLGARLADPRHRLGAALRPQARDAGGCGSRQPGRRRLWRTQRARTACSAWPPPPSAVARRSTPTAASTWT